MHWQIFMTSYNLVLWFKDFYVRPNYQRDYVAWSGWKVQRTWGDFNEARNLFKVKHHESANVSAIPKVSFTAVMAWTGTCKLLQVSRNQIFHASLLCFAYILLCVLLWKNIFQFQFKTRFLFVFNMNFWNINQELRSETLKFRICIDRSNDWVLKIVSIFSTSVTLKVAFVEQFDQIFD